jgi:hypothetical protein
MLTLLISAGCVFPMPVDDEVPYAGSFPDPDEDLITEDEVIRRLGEPDARYSHGSIFVYSDFEKTWEMPYFLVAPGSMGAEAGVAEFGDRHYLVLTFDDFGYLADRRVESGSGRAECSASGICFTAVGHIAWMAGEEEESRVKRFPASSNACGVYLYLEGTVFPRHTSVALDGDSLGHVGSIGAGFFYLEVERGEHLLVADQKGAEPGSVSLPVVCKTNELVFVRLKIRHNSRNPPILEFVDDSKGKRKVKSRRLIISQSSR